MRDEGNTHCVFTTQTGNTQIGFFRFGTHGSCEPRLQTGWRLKKDGTRELVHWKNDQWMSDVEVNLARVSARTF